VSELRATLRRIESGLRERVLGRHPENTVMNYNWVNVMPLVRQLARFRDEFGGTVADLGAGACPYRPVLAGPRTKWIAIDLYDTPSAASDGFERRVGDVTAVPLPDTSVDAVLSAQVLSQVPNPAEAVEEMFRILRGGGLALVSVPFVGPIHCEPADLYRFTPDGICSLLRAGGFVVESVIPQGLLFSAIALQIEMCLVLSQPSETAQMRLLPRRQLLLAPAFAGLNLCATLLDRAFPFARSPSNVLVAARKPLR
jgi:SAM-dependent methyltransferase